MKKKKKKKKRKRKKKKRSKRRMSIKEYKGRTDSKGPTGSDEAVCLATLLL